MHFILAVKLQQQAAQENEGMFTAKDVMPEKNFTAL